MRVMSWNVNSVNARNDRVAALLDRWNPDILLLQELKCMEEKFPFSTFSERGYKCYTHGQKTYNGVAIISKDDLFDIKKGFSTGYEDPHSRLISATIEDLKLRVYSAYIPNGKALDSDAYQYKLHWLKELEKQIQSDREAGFQILIGGDFNVAPTDREVHDPKEWENQILCSPPERACFQRLLDLPLLDSFRLHSHEPEFSWWDYRGLSFPLNRGLRIDFILLSPNIAEVCQHAWIDREERKGEKPSDHAPVVCELFGDD